MIYDISIGSAYNFSLLARGVLGVEYNNALVQAILDFDTAMLYQDVATLHAQVYSELKTGTPANPRDLTYIKIKTNTGEVRILAIDWIAAQPTRVNSTTVNVRIGNCDNNDIPVIRSILVKNGFSNITITTG